MQDVQLTTLAETGITFGVSEAALICHAINSEDSEGGNGATEETFRRYSACYAVACIGSQFPIMSEASQYLAIEICKKVRDNIL